jgi:hypothetical protein
MIQHRYCLASDEPDMWEADQCDRQAVTAEFAWKHLCDQPLYLFNKTASDMGMDAWVIVEGIDKLKSGQFIAETGSLARRKLNPTDRLYAQRSSLRKLGLPEGSPPKRPWDLT